MHFCVYVCVVCAFVCVCVCVCVVCAFVCVCVCVCVHHYKGSSKTFPSPDKDGTSLQQPDQPILDTGKQ